MDVSKLIYEIIEGVSAVSDDRFVDERLVMHKIGTARAEIYRKLMAKRPGYPTQGIEQDFALDVVPTTRSLHPGITLNCKILRSTVPVPKLIYEQELTNYYRIRTADIICNTIEVINPQRANSVVFEFPAVYSFLDSGYYAYFLVPKNEMSLSYAVLTGVFEDPYSVDPELTDYPIKASEWESIKPKIIAEILREPQEDPLNNSEPDYGKQQQQQRQRTK